jgi:hypothetical protein
MDAHYSDMFNKMCSLTIRSVGRTHVILHSLVNYEASEATRKEKFTYDLIFRDQSAKSGALSTGN